MAKVLYKLKKLPEAAQCSETAFTDIIKVEGPQARELPGLMVLLWNTYGDMGKQREARAFRARARRLGCDMSRFD